MSASNIQASAPRLAALNVTDHPDKGSQVGVIAKRTYVVRAGRCVVAGLGGLSCGSFPRSGTLGMTVPYDPQDCPPESFFEVKEGLLKAKAIAPVAPLAERLPLGAAQESAVGMRVPQLMPGASAVTLEPKIRTVLIRPELSRLCLVWVGEHQEPSPVGPGKRAPIKHAVQWPGWSTPSRAG